MAFYWRAALTAPINYSAFGRFSPKPENTFASTFMVSGAVGYGYLASTRLKRRP